MIKCIIVDDEPHAIKLMRSYIEKISSLQVVYTSTNPIEALHFAQQNPTDLIFLDIHMPELNGIQFLKLLGGKVKVILTTAYSEHAVESYEHDVVDYLLKPIQFDRFLKAVIKAENMLMPVFKEPFSSTETTLKEDEFILVKTETRGKWVKIHLNSITYIEGLGNYVAIHTDKGKSMCLITIKELEAKLPTPAFIRIHKSFIISIQRMTMIEGNQVHIDKLVIPIGENYKAKFLEVLETKIISKR